MEPVWEWIPVEDRTWDASDTNSCKSGRAWPVPESPTVPDSPPVGKEPDDGNSSSLLALSLPLAFLLALF